MKYDFYDNCDDKELELFDDIVPTWYVNLYKKCFNAIDTIHRTMLTFFS